MKLLTLFFILLAMLPSHLTMICKFKGCKTCNLRSGFCRVCSNNYFFKSTDDPACHRFSTTTKSIVDGCAVWGYHIDTQKEYCKICNSNYYSDHEGATCVAFGASKKCGAYCSTCKIKQGYQITTDGIHTICNYCNKGNGPSLDPLKPFLCGTNKKDDDGNSIIPL